MANYCSNCVQLNGSPQNITKAVAFINEWLVDKYDSLPNSSLTDIPIKEFTEEEKNDVYKSFGTKWIDLQDKVEDEEGFASFCADSAWSPFNEFLINLCEKFNVDAENIYEEGGNQIYGVFYMKGGEFTDNEMIKGEYFANFHQEGIEDELEYFDMDDYKALEHLLDDRQKKVIITNEFNSEEA